VGFEPTNGGFADLSLGPLGYRAVPKHSTTYSYYSIPYVRLAAKFAATFGPSLPHAATPHRPPAAPLPVIGGRSVSWLYAHLRAPGRSCAAFSGTPSSCSTVACQ
jgi:hypothetical protein